MQIHPQHTSPVDDTTRSAGPRRRRRALHLVTAVGALSLTMAFAGQSVAQADSGYGDRSAGAGSWHEQDDCDRWEHDRERWAADREDRHSDGDEHDDCGSGEQDGASEEGTAAPTPAAEAPAAAAAPAPAPEPAPEPAPAPAPAPVVQPLVAPAAQGEQAYKDYALGKVGAEQFSCLEQLWERESSWNPDAQNPSSTAYGIAQFLDSTWAGTGIAKTSDPYRQIDAGLIYVQNRYGSSCTAWNHFQANSWY